MLIAYFILMVVAITAVAGLGAFVAQTTNVAHRRNDMIAAIQFAQGAAVIACRDFNTAITNKNKATVQNLITNGYSLNTSTGNSSNAIYQRTLTAPYTNQSVIVQIWVPTNSTISSAKIVATTTVGKVTQTATVNVRMTWGYPAAIISTNPGTTETGISKSVAQNGNVVVSGSSSGPVIVDGGSGKAILANGRANIDTNYSTISRSSLSMTNYGTANEIPDYTAQGTANTLFDYARFIAIADLTPNVLNTNSGNNHFTNLTQFIAANNTASTNAAGALEGVIVVDIAGNDKALGNLNPSKIPNGINVRGTLFFNFDSSWGALDKVINTADLNINKANLSGLVVTNPATFTSGYPPNYYDNSKNPKRIDIRARGFANVKADEDLPAAMYSIGIFDMHGNVNVSGVLYTPSFFEIENKQAGQIQYFKGTLISGLGTLLDNNSTAKTVVSYDDDALDSLITLGIAGKQVTVANWE